MGCGQRLECDGNKREEVKAAVAEHDKTCMKCQDWHRKIAEFLRSRWT
jgi:predicted anti-sigma-YlaC factor YlaD